MNNNDNNNENFNQNLPLYLIFNFIYPMLNHDSLENIILK